VSPAGLGYVAIANKHRTFSSPSSQKMNESDQAETHFFPQKQTIINLAKNISQKFWKGRGGNTNKYNTA
jgi:hypothetical protein